jgi:hypothetical protein
VAYDGIVLADPFLFVAWAKSSPERIRVDFGECQWFPRLQLALAA